MLQRVEPIRKPASPSPGHARRGAALYLFAISVSVLVAGTGLTLIAVQRADRHLQDNVVQTSEVKWYARAGLEQALLLMEQTSDWRARVVNHKLIDALPVGDGTVTVEIYDDADGNLINNDAQAARILATARRGSAMVKLSGQLQARPHPALKYAVFGSSSEDMEFKSAVSCRGPVRNHGRIKRSSNPTATDDASFETITGYTIDSGLTPATTTASVIAAPAPDLATYTALATQIQGDYGTTCDLKGYNLTPTSNPTGSANVNGIYLLRAGGRPVNIENLHLKGTLIITETSGQAVGFSKGCWIEPGPLNYPTLLIDSPGGSVDIAPSLSPLIETTTWLTIPKNGSNYTPLLPGVDFNENGLTLDVLPTQIRGVIWSNCAQLTMETGSWPFAGSLIARHITINDSVSVDNDLTLLYNASPGFVESGMRIVQRSFQEVP